MPSLYRKASQQSFESLFDNKKDDKITTDSLSFYENDESDVDIIHNEFKFIDGRMFINSENSCQIVAVDEKSMSTMAILDVVYEHVWRGKFSAPIRNRLNNINMCVLDIGCGPGGWVTSMAESYPKSTFIRLDMVNVKKYELPNLAFIKSNIFDGLPFPDNTFDYVHQSNMMVTIKKDQWQFVIDEIIRVTKPNGWIEFMERDPTLHSLGPVTDEISKSFEAYLKSCGINTKINYELENMLLKTNKIADIGINRKSIPAGTWCGYIGELFVKNVTELLSARISSILDFMQLTEKEFKDIKEMIPLEYDKHKSYAKICRIYGRKI